MKSILVLLCLSVFISHAQIPGKQFSFNGTVQGMDTGIIYLIYKSGEGKLVRDSSILNHADFAFHGFITEPTLAIFKATKSRRVDDPNYTEVFLEPASMQVSVAANNFKDVHVTGSSTQTEFQELIAQKKPIMEDRQPLYTLFEKNRSAVIKEPGNAALKATDDSLRRELKVFDKLLNKADYRFIQANPQSFVSAYLLFYDLRDLPMDSSLLFYHSLTDAVQKNTYGAMVRKEIERQQRGLSGTLASDFSAVDVNGKTITLSSFKNKSYVLLDFWASWCLPCRQGIPNLLLLYKRYHPKGLEVIAVSIKDSANDWREAIAKDGAEAFHQVLDDENKDNSIASLFGVQSIPVKILIDKNGNIIGRFENYDKKDNDSDLSKALSALIPD